MKRTCEITNLIRFYGCRKEDDGHDNHDRPFSTSVFTLPGKGNIMANHAYWGHRLIIVLFWFERRGSNGTLYFSLQVYCVIAAAIPFLSSGVLQSIMPQIMHSMRNETAFRNGINEKDAQWMCKLAIKSLQSTLNEKPMWGNIYGWWLRETNQSSFSQGQPPILELRSEQSWVLCCWNFLEGRGPSSSWMHFTSLAGFLPD